MSDQRGLQAAWNFLGLPQELSAPHKARAWVLPVPYEATTCYGAGTREGPAAIIAASRYAELYDREFNCEPAMRYGVHTLPMLAPENASPEKMVKRIENSVTKILAGASCPDVHAVLGGEHSISAGVIRGLARSVHGNRLVAVHVDAHADMRDEYDGTPYSHACAGRRIAEICPIFQIGVRSLSESETRFCRRSKQVVTVFGEEANAPGGAFLKKLASFVRNKTVYFTIDLDGLDPSIMPSVGTPEPGGLTWELMLEVADVVCRNAARVPVFDVVELAPIPALRAPDFLAAILTYKIMSKLLLKRK
jgi:agmatinase